MIKEIASGLLKAVIGAAVIILVLCLLFQLAVQLYLFDMRYPGRSDETDTWFEKYRYDFNLINNYVIEKFDHNVSKDDDYLLMLIKENGYVTALDDHGKNIALSEELRTAFRNIDEAFSYYEYSSILAPLGWFAQRANQRTTRYAGARRRLYQKILPHGTIRCSSLRVQ